MQYSKTFAPSIQSLSTEPLLSTSIAIYIDPLGKKLILNNFSSADGYFLFIHATLNRCTQVRSAGFFFSNANYVVSLAGCLSQPLNDSSSDEIMVLEVALQTAIDLHIPVKHIFCAHHTILEFIQSSDQLTSWRFRPQLNNLKFLLDMCERPNIHLIPLSWQESIPAANLASIDFKHRNLNPFLFGRDLPYWIMRSLFDNGFVF